MADQTEALDYQARRAEHIAQSLTTPGVLILNDPVGSGKTIVALAAAKVLLESLTPSARRVTEVVIVAPDKTVAEIWADRARVIGWNPKGTFRMAGKAASRGVHVVTRAQLSSKDGRWLSAKPSKILLIIDEAHRGLHDTHTQAYKSLQWWAEGTRVLLVTATPFQLRPSGLEHMLGIDGQTTRGQRIKTFTRSVVAWLTALHDQAYPPAGADEGILKDAVTAKSAVVKETLAAAKEDLARFLMPRYERDVMGMPAAFALPADTPVSIDAEWERAYHAARILPDLLNLSLQEDDPVTRNSDSYMRMLNSSLAAWKDTSVYGAVSKAESPHIRALVEGIEQVFGTSELGHPKVAETARISVERALERNKHVLVFCVYKQTQVALSEAIAEALVRHVGPNHVRVTCPDRPHAARKLVRKDGFGQAPSDENPPMIMVVRDNLSESIDLDGGSPVVIHHDMSWSPVRWTQRLGRVVRASSGFAEIPEGDVVVPVLGTDIDRRLWQTMQARTKLTHAVAADTDDRALLDGWLPDWGQDD